jgi:hypothetical protein
LVVIQRWMDAAMVCASLAGSGSAKPAVDRGGQAGGGAEVVPQFAVGPVPRGLEDRAVVALADPLAPAAPPFGRHMLVQLLLELAQGAQFVAEPGGVPGVVDRVLGQQPGVAGVAVGGAAKALHDRDGVRGGLAGGRLGAGDWFGQRPHGVGLPVGAVLLDRSAQVVPGRGQGAQRGVGLVDVHHEQVAQNLRVALVVPAAQTVTDTSGATAITSRSVTVAAANTPPTASFTVTVDGLVATFDGRA